MDKSKADLNQLHDLVWREIAQRKDKVTGKPVVVPQLEPMLREKVESRFDDSFPVLRHLQAALALANQYELAKIAEHFTLVMDQLRWSQNPSYNVTNCSADLLNGYAYAAISGPDAPILCSVPRGGLMMMGPDVVYPAHQHQPKEIYLVLTPGVQWQLDEGEWFDVAPGDLIAHQSWQMHAMRTTDKPMLAIAGWIDLGERGQIGWSNKTDITTD